jgi:hypothetical protein
MLKSGFLPLRIAVFQIRSTIITHFVAFVNIFFNFSPNLFFLVFPPLLLKSFYECAIIIPTDLGVLYRSKEIFYEQQQSCGLRMSLA